MNAISTFEEAQAYLHGTLGEIVSRRTAYKLDRMRALLRELGDPHLQYPTVHVGGTSGKGSTSTMIAVALEAAGKRTGLHTKPHVRCVTERACVDGSAIAPQRLAELLDEMMPALERVGAEYGRPTYYETTLALAFVHFARERVDAAVIEVGLGGRLDGTNVVMPQAAAITSVGYDHMEVLGDTIEAIALEKAGIAKPGVPLIVAEVPAAALATIEAYAAQVAAPLVLVGDNAHVDVLAGSAENQTLLVTTRRTRYTLSLPVLGIFQRLNAATAVTVLEELREDIRPDPQAVERGFAKLAIPGRMEVFAGRTPVVFDIAHNAEKAASLVESLRERFAGCRIHYVVAIGESKDARGIVAALAQMPGTFTFTSFAAAGHASIPPRRLAAIAEFVGCWGRAIADPIDAFTVARRAAAAGDPVVVTGSTFVVAALREWYAPTAVR